MEEPEVVDSDLADEFAATAAVLGSGATVDDTFRLIVDAAIRIIPVCQYAGVFTVEDDRIRTVASSDPLVARIEQLQMQTGEGPCLTAVMSELPYEVCDDLGADPRYPRFGPRAVELGVRSVLGLRLHSDRRLGAANLYSELPHAFGALDRTKAVILATHCSVALAAAQARARDAASHRADLHAALASRSVIGQAQGILMEREHITADQAFTVLRHASQDLNVKLREIAQQVVDTGEDPPPPSGHDR